MVTTIDLTAGYKPHEGQMEAHQSRARIKMLRWARRYGKTVFVPYEMLRVYAEALEMPVSAQTEPPFHAWIVAPTYKQGQQVWRELVHFVPRRIIQGYEQNERNPLGLHHKDMYAELTGSVLRPEGVVEIKTAVDPDALQTAGLDFLCFTEAQDISNQAFERVMPTVNSPFRLGRVVIEGIPPTYPDHWTQRMWESLGRRIERGDPDVFRSHRTAFQNPYLSDQVKRQIEGDKEFIRESAWRRLYLAEFSANSGYFTNIDECATSVALAGPLGIGERYVGGCDVGRRMDPTVVHIFDAQKRRVVRTYEWPLGHRWSLVHEGVVRVCEDWKIESLVVDTQGVGDVFAEGLKSAGVPVRDYFMAGNSFARRELLEGLALAMEQLSVCYPRDETLIHQLWGFQPVQQPGGSWKIEAPRGEHDDHVFALALGLMACDPPGARDGVGGLRKLGGRYVPTQAELDNGVSEFWERRTRNRAVWLEHRKIEELKKMGVDVDRL